MSQFKGMCHYYLLSKRKSSPIRCGAYHPPALVRKTYYYRDGKRKEHKINEAEQLCKTGFIDSDFRGENV